MKLTHVVCTAGLVIGAAACGGPASVEPNDTATVNTPAPSAGDPTDAPGTAASADRTEALTESRGNTLSSELPATASPLPLAGAAGLLALAGAAAVRLLRR